MLVLNFTEDLLLEAIQQTTVQYKGGKGEIRTLKADFNL